MIKFEKVAAYKDVDFELPKRSTKGSAGYDFVCVEDIILPGQLTLLTKMIPDFIDRFTPSELMKIQSLSASNRVDDALDIVKEKLSISYDEFKELVKKSNSQITLVSTGVKAYMPEDVMLDLYVRSSTPRNAYIIKANGLGLVDSDYADNPDNEGHIMFQLLNLSLFDIKIPKGAVLGQGVFRHYLLTDDDNAVGERVGGFGSSSK